MPTVQRTIEINNVAIRLVMGVRSSPHDYVSPELVSFDVDYVQKHGGPLITYGWLKDRGYHDVLVNRLWNHVNNCFLDLLIS